MLWREGVYVTMRKQATVIGLGLAFGPALVQVFIASEIWILKHEDQIVGASRQWLMNVSPPVPMPVALSIKAVQISHGTDDPQRVSADDDLGQYVRLDREVLPVVQRFVRHQRFDDRRIAWRRWPSSLRLNIGVIERQTPAHLQNVGWRAPTVLNSNGSFDRIRGVSWNRDESWLLVRHGHVSAFDDLGRFEHRRADKALGIHNRRLTFHDPTLANQRPHLKSANDDEAEGKERNDTSQLDRPPTGRRFVLALCFYAGGFFWSLLGWTNFDNQRRLLSATHIVCGWWLSGLGLLIWLGTLAGLGL